MLELIDNAKLIRMFAKMALNEIVITTNSVSDLEVTPCYSHSLYLWWFSSSLISPIEHLLILAIKCLYHITWKGLKVAETGQTDLISLNVVIINGYY